MTGIPEVISVSPEQYSTGTASQSCTTVTGVGTTWTAAMVGSQLIYANGVSAGTIVAVDGATSLTVTTSQTIAPQAYTINYAGLQVSYPDTSSPQALLDIGSSGSVRGAVQLEGSTSGYVQLRPAAEAGSWDMTLPSNAGSSGYVLQTDGTGTTSWVAQSSGGSTANALASATTTVNVSSATAPVAGQVLTATSPTSATWQTGGGGGLSWQAVQTSDFTAVAGNGYPVNTTAAPITVTLPASPSVGDQVAIVDYAGTFSTNNLTIDPNGLRINSSTNNNLCVTTRCAITLTYMDATQGWLVTASSGASGQPIYGVYAGTYLVVGGGGGAGANTSQGQNAGGGGAGGYLTGTFNLIPGTTYTATIGGGGAASTSSLNIGSAGSNTSFTGQTTMLGGGGGGSNGDVGSNDGINGGAGASGGGGAGNSSGGAGTAGQGYSGGTGSGNTGAGGGGASAAGTGGSSGGAGGAGIVFAVTGTAFSVGGSGGNPGSGAAGAANTGNGGGSGSGLGGAGGSGVVYLVVPTGNYTGITTGSPTITTSGSNTIIKFTASGSYTA